MTPHSPRKRFGQHFLQDDQIIQSIVNVISPFHDQHIVEIGPGKGALTKYLLKYNCQLDIIELDKDLVKILIEKFNSSNQLFIHNKDVLQFDFKQLQPVPLRIIGNLPYNISTQLLFYLLDYAHIVQDMTFMLQKEVVERLIAVPATSDYGRLSVILQYHYQIYKLFDVKPESFWPPPKVQSSIVQLIPHSTPPVDIFNHLHFKQIVTAIFSKRRKTLRNNLKNILNVEIIQKVGIDPQVRGETLTLTEFAKLSNQFTLQNS
ncbi:16S rRNA (adenine(1518)-N(6)/adenine(1519)-N(6))-dimethyltransferase RsmA [Candidatus Halobeggiatoa sp. HSG11]|nr:16S rRNA (adenine(1518)-N(6)/adenine(1519)-N(6))-dimethyltransferase RsmA [Candidatus Halobeggiatoa sp. HSG11]